MHWGKGYKNTNKCWNQMIKRVPGRDLRKKKLQLQKKIQERKSPTQRWKKCNPVIKKKRQLLTESLISRGHFHKVGEDKEWKDVQKKDTNKNHSETRNKRKTRD